MTTVKPVEKTPEEKAAAAAERAERRAAREDVKLRKARIAALDAAQTCLRRASAALATGDEDGFAKWTSAAGDSVTQAVSLGPDEEDE